MKGTLTPWKSNKSIKLEGRIFCIVLNQACMYLAEENSMLKK